MSENGKLLAGSAVVLFPDLRATNDCLPFGVRT